MTKNDTVLHTVEFDCYFFVTNLISMQPNFKCKYSSFIRFHIIYVPVPNTENICRALSRVSPKKNFLQAV